MIPSHILNAVQSTSSAFILGGGALYLFHNGKIPTKDFDIFCHSSEIDYICKLLNINPKYKYEHKYSFKNTFHVYDGLSNGIKIDLVSYKTGFDPSEDLDFHTRMIMFDGYNFLFPTEECYNDCINLHLNFNAVYPRLTLTQMREIIDYFYHLKEIKDITKDQLVTCRNINKYLKKGFQLRRI